MSKLDNFISLDMGEDSEWELVWDDAAMHPKASIIVKVEEGPAVSVKLSSRHYRPIIPITVLMTLWVMIRRLRMMLIRQMMRRRGVQVRRSKKSASGERL